MNFNKNETEVLKENPREKTLCFTAHIRIGN